jgi:hypothetical protein
VYFFNGFWFVKDDPQILITTHGLAHARITSEQRRKQLMSDSSLSDSSFPPEARMFGLQQAACVGNTRLEPPCKLRRDGHSHISSNVSHVVMVFKGILLDS